MKEAEKAFKVKDAAFAKKRKQMIKRKPNKDSGGNNGEDTPVPIPNTEVKLSSADDTWVETPWESRSLPDLYMKALWLLP